MQDRMWGLRQVRIGRFTIFVTFFENKKNKEFWDEDKW